MNVTLPMGSTGEVHVPKVFGDRTVVLADGVIVWVGAGVANMAEAAAAAAAIMPVVVSTVEGIGQGEDDGRFVVFATAAGRTFASFEATTAAAAAAAFAATNATRAR